MAAYFLTMPRKQIINSTNSDSTNPAVLPKDGILVPVTDGSDGEIAIENDSSGAAIVRGIIEPTTLDSDIGVRGDETLGLLTSFLQVLPNPTDDIDDLMTGEIKSKMMTDAVINSTLHWLVDAALDRGVQFEPLIRDKSNPYYEISMRAYDSSMRALEDYQDELPVVLKDALVGALGWGNKISEKNCQLRDCRDGETRWCLKSLKPRNPNGVGYVVDPHGNVLGIASRTVGNTLADGRVELLPQGQNPTVAGVTLGNGVALPANWKVFDRRKFLVMSFHPKDGDVRGSSILRHIYQEWYLTQALWPHYLKYLMKFASPSVVGTVGENARQVRRGGASPVDRLYSDLLRFQNSSVMALPFDYKVDLLHSQGGGEAFVTAFGLLDRRMVRGMTNQTLASGESRHMARAASSTHQDQQNIVVRMIKQMAGWSVRRDLLRFLLLVNEGPEVAAFAPMVTLGGVAPEDQANMLDKYSLSWQRGYIHPSQLRGMDAELGLPYREEPEPGFFPAGATNEDVFGQVPELPEDLPAEDDGSVEPNPSDGKPVDAKPVDGTRSTKTGTSKPAAAKPAPAKTAPAKN